MYRSQCMINSMMLYSFQDVVLVNGSSKNMIAHALLSLLVFKHGFIQISFGILDFFCFCFMSNKYYLILLTFTRYLFSVKTIFFIDEKRTQ